MNAKTEIPDLRKESGTVLMVLEGSKMDEMTTMIEGIDSRTRENSVSILVGYSLISTEVILLQKDD